MNGIYFSANDAAIEWLIAAVTSVRARSSVLPICIIPYSDELTQVRALASKYNLIIWEDADFVELDLLGAKFRPEDPAHMHSFRRLSSFWGPFEHFMYADNDVIALMNWDEIVESFASSGDQFWYLSLSEGNVYYQGPMLDELRRKRKGVCFNSGAFVSSRGVLTKAAILQHTESVLEARGQLVMETSDQTFLNYCIDFSEITALSIVDGLPDVHGWNWAQSNYGDETNVFETAERTGTFRGKRFALVHWAGFGLVPSMPHRDLCLHYRLKDSSLVERARLDWKWRVRPFLGRWKQMLKPPL